jgi:hypothetical protein
MPTDNLPADCQLAFERSKTPSQMEQSRLANDTCYKNRFHVDTDQALTAMKEATRLATSLCALWRHADAVAGRAETN